MATVKPQLRGLGMKVWTWNLYISLAASSVLAVWYKINVLDARKKHYIEFYENYDGEKDYQRMKAAGIFKGYEKP